MNRYFFLLILALLALTSCSNPKEKAFNAIDEGKKKFYANDFRGAIREFNKALKERPDFDQALYYRGNAFFNLRKTDSAMLDYNKCIQVSPNFADVYVNRGSLRFDMGDRDGACQDWHKAKELGNESVNERLQNCP